MTDLPTPNELLSHLQTCRDLTRLAREHGALPATRGLTGARLARCQELITKLADAQAHAERLAFVVEGDLRAAEVDTAVARHPAGGAR
ncbi:hypothetical protein [Mycobacterium paraintracellulare]|uniref:ESX-1 secretion-associated protein n=1 Tax=Mycobacterium paraintracellulare TaxID=1138383 RepID=A0ABN6AUJ3_9MYCO|nr:hypothetical protein [Mycobacterium paraintracellulare]OSC28735.1 hypothetical protein B8W68_07220 [Mycobacterium paraintracellulare]BBY72457.1 hypothetical protein MPRI_46440 [Mycobacterium paraintracellulare]